ncbi:MAG: hypothetical protein LBS51_06375 [Oscillospiraceae bacterium]|jgi:formate C-acetyltransferase|nr:hypothetical protein [Oscillospiraceae bacterium]
MFTFEPLSGRIEALRKKRAEANDGNIWLDAERTKIYTDYYREHENEYPILKRAGAVYEWCAKKTLRLDDDDVFVGNLGRTYRSNHFYTEWGTGWMEDLATQSDEDFKAQFQGDYCYVKMTDEDRQIFIDAGKYWKNKTISACMAGIVPQAIWDLGPDGVTSFAKGPFLSNMAQGHYCPNFNKAIHVGFKAIKADAEARLAELHGRIFGSDAEKYTFYRAVATVCDAAVLLAKRYAALAAEKAASATGERREELLKMADSLGWIMENPCRNTWEALEVILLYQMILIADAQQHGLTLGRIDQYAGYFTDEELKNGSMTQAEAQDLADAFILKLGDHLAVLGIRTQHSEFQGSLSGMTAGESGVGFSYATNGQHFTVGGKKKDGTDATNALTLCFLKSYGRLFLSDPSISVRVHRDTPDIVWQLSIEASKLSGGMPTIENDDVIIPALMGRGLSLEDANDYCIIGCVEPCGCGNEWAACGSTGTESFLNYLGCVVHMINNGSNPQTGFDGGVKTGYLYDYKTFDEVKAAFEAQVRFFLDWHISFVNFYEVVYSQNFPCITASTTFDGCMEKGMDVTRGGAKYNSTGFTACGIGNVADSLAAIKYLCFDKKLVSQRELYDALRADWEGYENLRETVVNEVPHYGNADPYVDELAVWAMELYADHMNAATGPRGHYTGGTFTMTTHIDFGLGTVATPDGRKEGDPLADAISPRQGFDKNGPTTYLISAAQLPHVKLGNGDQLNIRFSPRAVEGDSGTVKLRDMFKTYFDMGGMQVQFNVVGLETLRAAQDKPADHKNLIVRIAGFSVYFVEMPRVIQDDFITRTEHFS